MLPVPIHLSFCVLLGTLCPLLEKEAACHMTNDTLLLPHNSLIDPPPLHYRNKNTTALQGQLLMHGKSVSEHNFSGMGCNFRVVQGQTQSMVYQGLSGLAGHPALTAGRLMIIKGSKR